MHDQAHTFTRLVWTRSACASQCDTRAGLVHRYGRSTYASGIQQDAQSRHQETVEAPIPGGCFLSHARTDVIDVPRLMDELIALGLHPGGHKGRQVQPAMLISGMKACVVPWLQTLPPCWPPNIHGTSKSQLQPCHNLVPLWTV